MKFNWGHGIALAYGIFAIALLSVVIKTTQYDHSLVTKAYYEKDLAYQEHYEKLANNQNLREQVKVWKDEQTQSLSIHFPEAMEKISGEVTFYRPSDSKEDFIVPFELDTNDSHLLEYNTRDMISGLWTIKIDWKAGQTPYYQEVYVDL